MKLESPFVWPEQQCSVESLGILYSKHNQDDMNEIIEESYSNSDATDSDPFASLSSYV